MFSNAYSYRRKLNFSVGKTYFFMTHLVQKGPPSTLFQTFFHFLGFKPVYFHQIYKTLKRECPLKIRHSSKMMSNWLKTF